MACVFAEKVNHFVSNSEYDIDSLSDGESQSPFELMLAFKVH